MSIAFVSKSLLTSSRELDRGKIGKKTTVKNLDSCSCVGVGKDPGRNSVAHIWHPGETRSQEHRQAFSEQWETQTLSSKWESVDLLRPCRPAVGWQRRPGRNSRRQIQGSWRGPRTAQCYRIPASPLAPLRYIAADSWFTLGGMEGSYEQISPNCHILVRTLASWLCLAGGLVLQFGSRKRPGRDTAWQMSWWSCPLWIEMLGQGQVGRNNGRRAARASSSALSLGSSRGSVTPVHPGLDRWKKLQCCAGKPGEWCGIKSSSCSGQQPAKFKFYTNSSSFLPIPKKEQRSDVL